MEEAPFLLVLFLEEVEEVEEVEEDPFLPSRFLEEEADSFFSEVEEVPFFPDEERRDESDESSEDP